MVNKVIVTKKLSELKKALDVFSDDKKLDDKVESEINKKIEELDEKYLKSINDPNVTDYKKNNIRKNYLNETTKYKSDEYRNELKNKATTKLQQLKNKYNSEVLNRGGKIIQRKNEENEKQKNHKDPKKVEAYKKTMELFIEQHNKNPDILNKRIQNFKERMNIDTYRTLINPRDENGFFEMVLQDNTILDELEMLFEEEVEEEEIIQTDEKSEFIYGANPLIKNIPINTRDTLKSYEKYKKLRDNFTTNSSMMFRLPNTNNIYEKYKKSLYF